MSEPKRFSGKKALVTGGGRGFGRAVAIALFEQGASVVVVDKMQENLDKLKQEYPEIQTIPVDLCDWEATRKTVDDLGIIDLLINNAGILILGPILSVTNEDLDKTFDINLKAVINVTQVVAKKLIDAGKPGSIVNLASIGALKGYKDVGVYCSSKVAMQMVSQVMALEFGPHNIRVNCINPGGVRTDMGKQFGEDMLKTFLDMTPSGHLATVEEIVKGIIFLLSDEIPIINGHSLVVDGGISLL